jgi:DNA-binding XRE family transcriptional regulator
MEYTNQITLEDMKEFGFFFKSMRESIGYSLTDMADLLDIHDQTLRRWEKGETVPHRDIKELENDIRRIVKYCKYQSRKVS